MEKLQKDCEEFILYSPDSLKYITDPMEDILKEKINEYKKIFNVDEYDKFQINYFDDIDKFRSFIYELRGEDKSLPIYAQGTFDNDMVNAYIQNNLDPSSPKYHSRLYMASHEIFHIMYRNIILKPLKMNRIIWYDEGMAQFLSGEYSKYLDEDEFIKFFLETKTNTKVIPDLNSLSHGENFENDSYSGYRLSYLAIRYLYETLGSNDFFELMKNENKILEYGTTIINEMFDFYTNKYLNNKQSLGKN